MNLLSSIAARLAPRRETIADSRQLAQFVGSRTAFVSQKCVTEFCRVRAGANWQQLFGEADFQAALMRSTWMSYTPVLAMIVELVEGMLRSQAPDAAKLRDRLVQMADELRSELALPTQVERADWANQSGLVRDRLAMAALAAPRPVRLLADPLARSVFDALPLHASLLTNDFDYIFNNLRMNLIRTHEDLAAIADAPRIIDSLLTS